MSVRKTRKQKILSKVVILELNRRRFLTRKSLCFMKHEHVQLTRREFSVESEFVKSLDAFELELALVIDETMQYGGEGLEPIIV